jgi:hypothetical protein
MPKKCIPGSSDDWRTLEPSEASTAKMYCGKVTGITPYDNGRYSVGVNYCGRWDCESCAAEKRAKYRKWIASNFSNYYWVQGLLSDDELFVITMTADKAGSKWVAAGTSKSGWVVFVEKQVIPNSRVVPKSVMEGLVDLALKGEYTFRERRLRFSEGILPPCSRGQDRQRPILVIGTPAQVKEKLKQEGYVNSWKRKRITKDGVQNEVDGDMMEDIKKNKWLTVLDVGTNQTGKD